MFPINQYDFCFGYDFSWKHTYLVWCHHRGYFQLKIGVRKAAIQVEPETNLQKWRKPETQSLKPEHFIGKKVVC